MMSCVFVHSVEHDSDTETGARGDVSVFFPPLRNGLRTTVQTSSFLRSGRCNFGRRMFHHNHRHTQNLPHFNNGILFKIIVKLTLRSP